MKYRYRSDEEMKDSEVEWIGKIPKDWQLSRIDKEFKVRNEKVSDKKFAPLSVTKQGILPQLESVAKTDNGDNRKKVCIGDFVINSRADRKGSCGVSDYNGSVSLICNVLTPKELNSRYIHNLFRNYYFSEEFYRWGSGIVDDLWSTNIERMKKINIPIPIEKEQNKIAKFLDEKTSDFDNIISKKEKLIEKSEEAKKSLISEVVTGKVKVVKNGEDFEIVKRNDSDMKDSGVEWIGKIPKDWTIEKFSYLIKIKNGQVDPRTSPYKEMTLIAPNHIESNSGKIISLETALEQRADSGKYICDKDDIIYSKIRPNLCKVCISPCMCLCSADMYPMKSNSKKLLQNYILWILLSDNFTKYAILESERVAMPKINRESLSKFKIALPSLEEQIILNNFLIEYDKNINHVIEKMNLQIAKLKEAKQALISEAVTGKIEILD